MPVGDIKQWSSVDLLFLGHLEEYFSSDTIFVSLKEDEQSQDGFDQAQDRPFQQVSLPSNSKPSMLDEIETNRHPGSTCIPSVPCPSARSSMAMTLVSRRLFWAIHNSSDIST